MCKSELHTLLAKLPKVETHIHLEGALTPEVLFQLAAKNEVTLPSNDLAFESPVTLGRRYHDFSSLDDFLHYYYIGMSVLIDAADFEALAWDYFSRAAADGVAHAEVFFDPQAHLSRGVTYDAVLGGFRAAQARAHAAYGLTSELICCFLRHLPAQDALKTFNHEAVQRSFADSHVIGIGLDSSELGYPPELFKDVYQQARLMGLRMTAHAGEEGPAAFIGAALDELQVQRIDHGIRLAEDEALFARVVQEKTLLTVCPISNVFLRCVSSVAELPIRKFLEAGVCLSINSDDPAYFGGNYILANYCAVQEAFDLTADEWLSLCTGSIQGSWASSERKKQLMNDTRTVLADWAQQAS